MTQQPEETPVQVVVGRGNPHLRIKVAMGAAKGAGLALIAIAFYAVIGQNADLYKALVVGLVMVIGLFAYALHTSQKHHDEMQAATEMFASIATTQLRNNARARGEDPIQAWKKLVDEVQTELGKDTHHE